MLFFLLYSQTRHALATTQHSLNLAGRVDLNKLPPVESPNELIQLGLFLFKIEHLNQERRAQQSGFLLRRDTNGKS